MQAGIEMNQWLILGAAGGSQQCLNGIFPKSLSDTCAEITRIVWKRREEQLMFP